MSVRKSGIENWYQMLVGRPESTVGWFKIFNDPYTSSDLPKKPVRLEIRFGNDLTKFRFAHTLYVSEGGTRLDKYQSEVDQGTHMNADGLEAVAGEVLEKYDPASWNKDIAAQQILQSLSSHRLENQAGERKSQSQSQDL